MTKQNKTLKFLRLVAILEGISYLLFALTMPLKYVWEIAMPNKIVGMAHGVLFILYVVMVFVAWPIKKWSFEHAFYALYASLIPLGTFITEKYLFQDIEVEN